MENVFICIVFGGDVDRFVEVEVIGFCEVDFVFVKVGFVYYEEYFFFVFL